MWKEHLNVDSTVSQQEWAVFLQTLYTDKNYKEYDGLLQTAMGTIDQNIRMDAMHKAEKILMDNDVIIPLYYYSTPILINSKLKNVVFDSLGKHRFSYAYIEK